MSLINNKFRCHISWLIFLSLAIQIAYAVSSFTDVPRKFSRKEKQRSLLELPSISSTTKASRTVSFSWRTQTLLARSIFLTQTSYSSHTTVFYFKVHEYYAIIGRPRFGRALMRRYTDPLDIHLLYMLDNNDDNSITDEQFDQQFRK